MLLALGPIRVHVDVLVVALGLAGAMGPMAGIGFVAVIGLHELAHALVARAVSGPPFRLHLQLANGSTYLDEGPLNAREVAVLAAGPVLGGGAALVAAWGLGVETLLGGHLLTIALFWLGFQLLPWPVTDTGAIFMAGLWPLWGRTRAWWTGWGFGFAVVGALVWTEPGLIVPVAVLTSFAVLLARNEWNHLRHLALFDAFEAGRFEAVVIAARSRAWPTHARRAVAELGVHAALELERAPDVGHFVAQLDETSAIAVEAAGWLLQRRDELGVVAAERFHAEVDRRPGGMTASHDELYAELAYRHAVFEAEKGRLASARGLLERASAHGFSDRERFHAEAVWSTIDADPRLVAVRSRLRPL